VTESTHHSKMKKNAKGLLTIDLDGTLIRVC